MTIGARIKQLQKDLGYSSAEKFAEVLEKTTASRLSDVIRGKQKLPDDLMFELITKFNVNANWIIAGVGDVFIGKIPEKNLTLQEQSLIEDYRESNEQGKEAIEKTARALSEVAALANNKVA
ncbi:XRE family transcriptional regulator [Aggregatibacter actinomycetemcomitans]|uniref:XRE family transcriptional regulator n=1 Tax=Aggregatibacter actinomycetemcomitans TaxID=714 RepID=UPI00197C5E8F|nr:XRE family transcriptional regulator [Aggregatibacter actinomycetemcomitans]MBN6075518.1 XRE family transcriptional regulator [Aggregatibacter actinomycetemcomitans]